MSGCVRRNCQETAPQGQNLIMMLMADILMPQNHQGDEDDHQLFSSERSRLLGTGKAK